MGICAGAGAAIDTDGFDLVHAILILFICHVAMQCKSVKAKAFAKASKSTVNWGKSLGNCCPFEGARGAQTLYMTHHVFDEKNTRDGESARHLTSGFY
jgi:hypothetical protein